MSGASDGTSLVTFEVKQSWLAAQSPAITVGAISTTGVLGAVAVAWKKGYLKQQNKTSPIAALALGFLMRDVGPTIN